MRRIQRRRVHLMLATLVMLVGAGCSKSDAPRGDSAAAGPPRQSAAPAPLVGGANQGQAARKALPGDLTKPIDDYTGDEFYALVKKLQYTGGHSAQRNCRNDPGCGSTKKITVDVDAVATQDSIAPGVMPQYGLVYIRAINKGNATEALYGMAPGNKYEYYVILSNDSTGQMIWRLEQLDTTPQARRHASIGTGHFLSCDHKTWTRGARADFKTCAQSAAAHDSVVRLGLAFQSSGDPPIWSECASGCCTAITP